MINDYNSYGDITFLQYHPNKAIFYINWANANGEEVKQH